MNDELKNKWTIMVYMSGDNNLSDDMITGLLGMESDVRKDVSLLARFDSGEPSIQTVYIDFTGGVRKFTQPGSYPKVTTIQDEKTSLSSLCKFVEFCIDNHKAGNYVLILSGHGDGFLNTHFMRDENPFSYMTIRGLRNRLFNLCKQLLGDKLKILGFDSCVMNTLEVAYEMRKVANVLVSSQGYVPSAGWDYKTFIQKLNAITTEALSEYNITQALVDSFIEANKKFARYGLRSVDICGLDLQKVGTVVEKVNELAVNLENALGEEELTKQVKQLILFSHWECQTFLFDQSIDLRDFCEILLRECEETDNSALKEICDSCASVIKAVEASTVYKPRNVGPEYQYANGISLFFPWSYTSYRTITRERYRNLEFPFGKDISIPEQRNLIDDPAEVLTAQPAEEDKQQKSDWVSFLDYYLQETMRPGRKKQEKGERKFSFLFDAEGTNFAQDKTFLEIDPKFKAFEIKSSADVKVDPYSGRPRGASASIFEYFRRMKNFPWSPHNQDPEN